ncbi:cell division inhibitor protein [Escherichia coli]|nr:cell division inhibitor protein [Escherichia coli]
MVHQHYGTQTVNRGAVMQNAGQTQRWYWTASANLRGRLYLHRGIERTYTRDLLVEVFLDGRGNGLNH